ncbi:MAG: NfeD family protein [Gammaproteobacteria bacterium]
MPFDLLPWHWFVFGVVLVLLEIFLTSFVALWFGAAAILVAGLLFFMPELSQTHQLLSWSVLSAILAFAWFKYLKPLSVDKTKAGLSKEAIVGQVGQVIATPAGEQRGKLRFSVPILGSEEWHFIAEESTDVGDRVRVIDVSGNTLVIEKHGQEFNTDKQA